MMRYYNARSQAQSSISWPWMDAYPNEIKTVGMLQLIAGAYYLLGFVSAVLCSCGAVIDHITPMYGIIIASLELWNGIKTVGGRPDPGRFWWQVLPILGIVAVIALDVWSCIFGIVGLILCSRPHVKEWIR